MNGRVTPGVSTGRSINQMLRLTAGLPTSNTALVLITTAAIFAIRGDVPLLHMDADFDILAQHTTLRVHVA